ncbi:MAG: hypothetical protein ABI481_12530, partial [Pyrinomonadaceae bacterium]
MGSKTEKILCQLIRLLRPISPSSLLPLKLLISAIIVASVSCGSKPTDPRSVIPGDALVYLESRDLGRTLLSITENPKFEDSAKFKPNLDALSGVRVSIAVTGFETSEQEV